MERSKTDWPNFLTCATIMLLVYLPLALAPSPVRNRAHLCSEIVRCPAGVLMFSTSVWLGLKKGIKRLSDCNMVLAFGLLAFVLVVGPTLFILKSSVNSVGLLLQN